MDRQSVIYIRHNDLDFQSYRKKHADRDSPPFFDECYQWIFKFQAANAIHYAVGVCSGRVLCACCFWIEVRSENICWVKNKWSLWIKQVIMEDSILTALFCWNSTAHRGVDRPGERSQRVGMAGVSLFLAL